MNILKKDTDFFGLDIGSTAIRVVQFKNAANSSTYVTHGVTAINDNLSRSDSAQDKQKVGQMVKQLLQESRVTSKNVVAGLPSNKVFSSIVSLPKMSHQELAKAINYQADQYVPMPIDEAQVDWTVLDESKPDQIDVLLVATNRKTTEDTLEMLEAIGLEVLAIEPDAVATTRSIISRTTELPVVVLDVGAYSSDIVIAYRRNPWVIRTVPVGGNTFIKSASQNLNIDEEQATQFVQKFGLTKTKLEGQVFKALESSVNSLTDEVTKSIKFFNSRYQDQALEKVILTGRVSSWPDFPLHIADTLNMPVEIGNSWINISYPANLQDILLGVSNQFAVAAGLAQRRGSA